MKNDIFSLFSVTILASVILTISIFLPAINAQEDFFGGFSEDTSGGFSEDTSGGFSEDTSGGFSEGSFDNPPQACDPTTQSCPPSDGFDQEFSESIFGSPPASSSISCPQSQPTLRMGSSGADVTTLQNILLQLGYDVGVADGQFGPKTDAAVKQFQSASGLVADGIVGPNTWNVLCTVSSPSQSSPSISTCDPFMASCPDQTQEAHLPLENAQNPPTTTSTALPWGKKVSVEFKDKVIRIASNMGTDPAFFMAAMAFETGETFSPSILNAAGSGAVGLIQFMPSTAKNLGTSTDALKSMTAEQQLDYVEKYFLPYKGKLKTLEDIYMAILWPKAVGQPLDSVLFASGTKAYDQNKGLDSNQDGKITKMEAASKVQQKLEKGNKPENFG